MDHVSVYTDGIRGYAATAAQMAEQVAGAGAMDMAAAVVSMGPVFGLIGADFLAAFGVTGAQHMASVAGLTEVLGATSTTASAIADAYDETDHSLSTALQDISDRRGVSA